MVSDEKIIQAIRNREEQVISMVMRKYSKLLWKVTSAILINASSVQEVEECVADVFIYLWLYPEKYEPEKGKLSSWLCMVARSKAIDRYRSIIRKQEISIEESYKKFPSKTGEQKEYSLYDMVFQMYGIVRMVEPLAKMVAEEEKETLFACIETLEELKKEILVRRYYYEQKPKEIALALDMPKKQVENCLYQTKQKLKKKIEQNNRDIERVILHLK